VNEFLMFMEMKFVYHEKVGASGVVKKTGRKCTKLRGRGQADLILISESE